MFQNLVVLPSNLRKVISINYVIAGSKWSIHQSEIRDAEICKLIDEAGDNGDTLGGVLEVRIEGTPFRTHAQWGPQA